jgi:hypothetical protein
VVEKRKKTAQQEKIFFLPRMFSPVRQTQKKKRAGYGEPSMEMTTFFVNQVPLDLVSGLGLTVLQLSSVSDFL